jgi:hypothetical protein
MCSILYDYPSLSLRPPLHTTQTPSLPRRRAPHALGYSKQAVTNPTVTQQHHAHSHALPNGSRTQSQSERYGLPTNCPEQGIFMKTGSLSASDRWQQVSYHRCCRPAADKRFLGETETRNGMANSPFHFYAQPFDVSLLNRDADSARTHRLIGLRRWCGTGPTSSATAAAGVCCRS